MFFSFLKKKRSTGIFIPSFEGFVELKERPGNGSINSIIEHLGYHPDQVFVYHGDFDHNADVHHVGFEVFTEDILFVLTKNTVTNLRKAKVDYFLKNFRLVEQIDSIVVRDILEEGIKNESLKIDFLSRVLNIRDPEDTGVFFVDSIGLYLIFENGLLKDFQPADGLNEWAKSFRNLNPDFIKNYEDEARKYWGGDISKIIKEINIQSEALANTPNATKNEFSYLHRNKCGLVNYSMLMVCHYGHNISLSAFKEINHGRYEELDNTQDPSIVRMKLNKHMYEFSNEGELLSYYLA